MSNTVPSTAVPSTAGPSTAGPSTSGPSADSAPTESASTASVHRPASSAHTEVEYREVPPEDWSHYVAVAMRQFHAPRFSSSESDAAFRAKRYAIQRLTAAYAGGTVVGTFRSWDAPLAVPGALVDADFISTVTVSPTHRRRGVLTELMGRDLRQAKDAGTPLAYLIASSAQIYGRFGYGVCTEHCTWTVDAGVPFRAHPEAEGLSVEIGNDTWLRDLAPVVYAAAYPLQPGARHRDDDWWDAALGLAELSDDEKDAMRSAVVVRDGAGVPVAYARYTVKESVEQRVDTSQLEVQDLVAATDAGYARIWQFLASIDLLRTVRAGDRSPDEPLPWLLADRRSARQSELADFSWARILDVPKALTGRRYLTPGAVVVEIVDAAGLAGGTFALEVADDGTAVAEPTTGPADVTMDVATLGSVYLGQVRLDVLRAAGRVVEHVDGAVDRLGRMLIYPARTWNTHTWF